MARQLSSHPRCVSVGCLTLAFCERHSAGPIAWFLVQIYRFSTGGPKQMIPLYTGGVHTIWSTVQESHLADGRICACKIGCKIITAVMTTTLTSLTLPRNLFSRVLCVAVVHVSVFLCLWVVFSVIYNFFASKCVWDFSFFFHVVYQGDIVKCRALGTMCFSDG